MLQRPILRLLNPKKSNCRSIFWWGHDGPDDQARKIQAAEDKKVLKWEEPIGDLDVLDKSKERMYAPARIIAEENAMSNGYSWERFNFTDWYSMTCHPYLARLDNPQYYACYKKQVDYKKLIDGQRFVRERLIALGPDLAAAHFLLARGCKVKFSKNEEWTLPYERFSDEHVPQVYTKGYHVEGIENYWVFSHLCPTFDLFGPLLVSLGHSGHFLVILVTLLTFSHF